MPTAHPNMTVYEIMVLLHYHCMAQDHEDITRNPPVWRPTIAKLKGLGLLVDRHKGCSAYEITERGRVYVTDGLCAAPLPVQRWVMPDAWEER